MHNPFAGFGGGGFGGGGFPFPGGFAGGGGGGFHNADVDELLRNLFGSGGAFGGTPGYQGQGFGGMPRQRYAAPPGGGARPQQQQPQQPGTPGRGQGQQQAGGGVFGGGGLGGLHLQSLLPFLPVLLMFAGQFISVLPFLVRVRAGCVRRRQRPAKARSTFVADAGTHALHARVQNLQLFMVLYYACPAQYRGSLMRVFVAIVVFQLLFG